VDFLKKLKTIEVSDLTEKDLKKLRTEYIEKKDKNGPIWDNKRISEINKAAGNLATWAKAMSDYQKVWKTVEPKKKKLQEMNLLLE